MPYRHISLCAPLFGAVEKTAYIGVGSNLGDREGNCLRAVERVRAMEGCEFLGRSGWYLTSPVGTDSEEWFLNGVACVSARISARSLLEGLLAIEKEMGRARKERWGPRIIDLDILLFGKDVVDEEGLKIPHPLMPVRRFVLVPLVSLAPDLVHPTLGLTMSRLLERAPAEGQAVIPYEEG